MLPSALSNNRMWDANSIPYKREPSTLLPTQNYLNIPPRNPAATAPPLSPSQGDWTGLGSVDMSTGTGRTTNATPAEGLEFGKALANIPGFLGGKAGEFVGGLVGGESGAATGKGIGKGLMSLLSLLGVTPDILGPLPLVLALAGKGIQTGVNTDRAAPITDYAPSLESVLSGDMPPAMTPWSPPASGEIDPNTGLMLGGYGNIGAGTDGATIGAPGGLSMDAATAMGIFGGGYSW
jgi:hypothetical protein